MAGRQALGSDVAGNFRVVSTQSSPRTQRPSIGGTANGLPKRGAPSGSTLLTALRSTQRLSTGSLSKGGSRRAEKRKQCCKPCSPEGADCTLATGASPWSAAERIPRFLFPFLLEAPSGRVNSISVAPPGLKKDGGRAAFSPRASAAVPTSRDYGGRARPWLENNGGPPARTARRGEKQDGVAGNRPLDHARGRPEVLEGRKNEISMVFPEFAEKVARPLFPNLSAPAPGKITLCDSVTREGLAYSSTPRTTTGMSMSETPRASRSQTNCSKYETPVDI